MVNTIITNGGGTAASEINFTLAYSQFTTNSKNYCSSIGTDNATPGTTPTFDFHSGNSTLNISGTLTSNGGATQSLSLLTGSSLIDAGTVTSGTGYDIPIKDQRNYSRTDAGVDIGAFEYNGITDNASTPVISYTPPGNTLLTTDRVINTTITDANGVYWYPQSTDLRPRIYFRKNTGSWSSAVGTLASGTGLNGSWNFTISSAAMGGLVNGDDVYYYIVAQDVSSAASLVSSPSGVNAANVNTIVSAPVPNTYKIGSPTLPVKLEKFTATAIGRNAVINWWVGEEHNVSHYEVERSKDAVSWTPVGRTNATGLNFYTLTDRNLAEGIYFYRLRSVDLDAKVSISNTEQVRFGSTMGVVMYPNPVTEGYCTIELSTASEVSLFNSSGALVWKKKWTAGAHRFETKLTPGMYHVVTDAGESASLIIR